MKKLILSTMFSVQICWGWGEVGHHLIARSAVEILEVHPALSSTSTSPDRQKLNSFLRAFQSKQYQQGHVSNIPDTYWRNLDQGLGEEGTLLGSPSHYFDSEELLTLLKLTNLSEAKIPLSYLEAKTIFPQVQNFFKSVGSLPWRAEQFSTLYSSSLKKQVADKCALKGELTTRTSLTFAGLLSHFTGDVSMPYHTTIDHDAIALGQKGIHGYFERDLVSELEIANLYAKVVDRAKSLLRSEETTNSTPSVKDLKQMAQSMYQDKWMQHSTSALMMALAGNSFSLIEKLRQLDYTFAIATLDEAMKLPQCQNLKVVKELKNQYDKLESIEQKAVFGKVKVLSTPGGYHDKTVESACRRQPTIRVNEDGELSESGKTVAQWHEELIIERLAVSAALTADIWVQEWLKAGAPELCQSYLYAHKPSFVSPTDSQCFGYALNESPKEFLKKDGKSALTSFKQLRHSPDCVSF